MYTKMRLIIPLLIVTALIAMSFSKIPSQSANKNNGIYKPLHLNILDSGDIAVGNRTSDSTGDMVISSSDIQTSIVSDIPYLNGMDLNLTTPSLMITPVAAYIILKGTDANSTAITVAIQLTCNEDSSIIFHTHSKTMVHVCKKVGGCNNCQFITLGNLIFNCGCAVQNPSDSTNQECRNTTYMLR